MSNNDSNNNIENISCIDDEKESEQRLEEIRFAFFSNLYVRNLNCTTGRTYQFFKRKGYDKTLSKQVIISLVKDGYIDDVSCAKQILENRKDKKAEGKPALKRRMQTFGIANVVIDRVIEHYYKDEVKQIICFLEQKYKELVVAYQTANEHQLSGKAKFELRQKLFRKCQSRQFSSEASYEAINRLIKESD